MFKYTRATINKLVQDIRRFARIFQNASLVLTSAYFIFALVSKTGNFYANVALAILFVAYTIFEIATRGKGLKRARKNVKKGYKWTKLGIKALTLGAMLYGIYTATISTTPMSIILATLMIILWILQFFLALICEVIESKYHMLMVAFNEDVKRLKIFGKRDEEQKPREIVILDEQIEKEEAEKEAQRQKEKEDKIIARQEKRQARRQAREQRRQERKQARAQKSPKDDKKDL